MPAQQLTLRYVGCFPHRLRDQPARSSLRRYHTAQSSCFVCAPQGQFVVCSLTHQQRPTATDAGAVERGAVLVFAVPVAVGAMPDWPRSGLNSEHRVGHFYGEGEYHRPPPNNSVGSRGRRKPRNVPPIAPRARNPGRLAHACAAGRQRGERGGQPHPSESRSNTACRRATCFAASARQSPASTSRSAEFGRRWYVQRGGRPGCPGAVLSPISVTTGFRVLQ